MMPITTKEGCRDAADVMIAFAEGKRIEFRVQDEPPDRWYPCYYPIWAWNDHDYRVAVNQEEQP